MYSTAYEICDDVPRVALHPVWCGDILSSMHRARTGGVVSPNGASVLFEKILTQSDTNGQGRIILPKVCPSCGATSLITLQHLNPLFLPQAAAERHLPTLNSHTGKTLVVVDTHGVHHEVQFRYWTNTQSRMYIMEGMLPIQQAYQMSAGDVLVFSANTHGQFIVYGRPATPADAKSTRRAGAHLERRTAEKQQPCRDLITPKRIKLFKQHESPTTSYQHPLPPATPTHALDEDTILRLCHALDIEAQRALLPQPIIDGVFREVIPPTLDLSALAPGTPGTQRPCSILLRAVQQQGVWLYDAGCWLASVTIEGALFHAAFTNRKDAEDALLAARQEIGGDEGV